MMGASTGAGYTLLSAFFSSIFIHFPFKELVFRERLYGKRACNAAAEGK